MRPVCPGIRHACADADRSELDLILAGNAANVFGFDRVVLVGLDAEGSPTVEGLRYLYASVPTGNRSPAFVRARASTTPRVIG